MNKKLSLSAMALVTVLAGCATPNDGTYANNPYPNNTYPNNTYPSNTSYNGCQDCGVIQNIVAVGPDNSIGIGTVIGGVAGALVGSTVGGGNGRTAAEIAGAAGGAYAGHQIEKNTRTNSTYRFEVRMDDGSYRTITQAANPGFRQGDSVRVVNNTVIAR